MHYIAEPQFNTPAYYSVIGQRSNCSNATTQSTDELARVERYSTVSTAPPPPPLAVQLSVNGQQIKFTYEGPASKLPAWAGPVLRSLTERWGAYDGWDSYDSKPTNPQLVVRLLNILSGLMEESYLAPITTPLADGGIQAEWHHQGKDLEIVVSAGDDPTYYYFDGATSEEAEGDLRSSDSFVGDLIGRISQK